VTRCVCAVCGREVNGRVPARGHGDNIVPFRHLPPRELGQPAPEGCGWFGHGRWCVGSYQAAKQPRGQGLPEVA
jgi:hypothetical protein